MSQDSISWWNIGNTTEDDVGTNDNICSSDFSLTQSPIQRCSVSPSDQHQNASYEDTVEVTCSRTVKLADEDVIGHVFPTLEDAEQFYNSYARARGFSVRKDIKRIDQKGEVIIRRWVCSKQGRREQKYIHNKNRVQTAKPLTREDCLACFRVNRDPETMTWVVREFVDTHSHEMVPFSQIQFLPSHRNTDKVALATSCSLHHFGIKPSQIHEFMAEVSGGYENVGFTNKDLHNRLAFDRQSQIHCNDAESTLSLLQSKHINDSCFFYQYTLDADNRLCDIFWCDSGMRADYQFFGDVLCFDSTYRTNIYNKLLVMFVGVNHHRRSVLFGFALLSNETEQSYKWLLGTFVDAMGGKKPTSVVTDGDRAMRNAISSIFSEATHRLCSWHLEKNAQTNVADPNFTKNFTEVMFSSVSSEVFERKWQHMVHRFNVHKSDWVKKIYEDRHLWAEAFLKGKFFGGLRTTKRLESMNAYLNRYVNRRMKLWQLVTQMDRMVNRQRNKEAEDDYTSTYTTPVSITHLHRSYEA